MRERAIPDALQSLKTALEPKSKGKRKQDAAAETLGHVTSYLVFLVRAPTGSIVRVD